MFPGLLRSPSIRGKRRSLANIRRIPDKFRVVQKNNCIACKSIKITYLCTPNMVDVVQLVEHRIVVPSVVGSSPIIHP